MEYITGIIEVELDEDTVIQIDVDEVMKIDDNNLSEEFTRQASLLAYVATLAAQAEGEWLYAKNYLNEVKAHTYIDVRQDLMAGGEKVTEARIAAGVETTRGYIEEVDNEVYRKVQYRTLRGLVDALVERGRMLQSLGAQLRAELDQTDMIIRKAKASAKGLAEKEYTIPFD